MNLFKLDNQTQVQPIKKNEVNIQIGLDKPENHKEQIKILTGSAANLDNAVKVTINYKYDLSSICSLMQNGLAMNKLKNITDIVQSVDSTINNFDINEFAMVQESIDESIRRLLIFSNEFQKLTVLLATKK